MEDLLSLDLAEGYCPQDSDAGVNFNLSVN